MSDEPDNSNQRLEGMLRKWGAAEALRTTEVGAAPAPPLPGRRDVSNLVLRWAPLAAAAVLLIAAVAFFIATEKGPGVAVAPRIEDMGPGGPGPTTVSAAKALQRLRDENAEMRKQLDRQQRQLAAMGELQDKLKTIEGDLTKARSDLESERARHRTDVQELMASVKARQKDLGELKGKVDSLGKRVDAAEKARDAALAAAKELPAVKVQLAAVENRLAAAADELTRVRKLQVAAEKAAEKNRQELALAKAREQQMLSAFRGPYLATAAPGEEGLRAAQVTAGSRRMLARCAELRGDVRSETTRLLLDKLEVVLTRLDLLDTSDAVAAESFLKLIAAGDLPGQIDAAMGADAETRGVRSWLFEARLILMGV